ncbi:MAG: hypothetical protein C0619_04400 [Desulfuromonas sp.]|nr:MAG: hypothetical protein C0619_04400 [Desulfuromonas sp.]
MTVHVVLNNGKERKVTKDQLQYLLTTQKVWYFKRSDGWAVVGLDKMRTRKIPGIEEERRSHEVFALE